ncbi:MAG: PQQ-binding-like beta-propeller repeat protein [Planctomycetaceae bacterium]|nr:PQQ-binding-like beta-propeller repeat protein [Planctomycetaceae bacterium]
MVQNWLRGLVLVCVAGALPGLTGCSRPGPDPELATTEEVSVDSSTPVEEAEPVEVSSDDWPWWRGPNRNNIAGESAVPVKWTEDENIVWKASVPGRGHSAATVVGENIFLATADEQAEEQSVLCLNRADGKQKWQTTISTGGFPPTGQMHAKSTHATCTVACDGRQVYVVFLHHQALTVTALDLDGKKVWEKEVGPFDSKFGYAPSPALLDNFVYVAGDHQAGGYVAALHRDSGEIVWLKKRPAVATYSSPVVAEVAGKNQLLISGAEKVTSYDPATGGQLWEVDGTAEATCGTLVWEDGVVFASGGYPQRETLAVKADGSAEVVWRNDQKAYVPSMIVSDGSLYAVSDNGVAYCWDATTGTEQWKSRLDGDVSASPVLAAGNIYVPNESGKCSVFRATPEKFELVAENQLGNETFATPSICGGKIYIRAASGYGENRKETLYCIGSSTGG